MQSIITDSTITLISETGPSVIGKTHPNFYKIKKALLQKNFLEVEEMLDVKNGYKEFSNAVLPLMEIILFMTEQSFTMFLHNAL